MKPTLKFLLASSLVLLCAGAVRAANSVTPWVPIFKGIEQATGTNNGFSVQLSVDAVRVDLHDPDIRLLVTPPVTNNYVVDQRETFLQTPREFMLEHGLQIAVNGSFFSPAGYSFPSGSPSWLTGPVISKGRTVSVQSSSNDSLSAVYFTTNNQATFAGINWPPASTAGMYSALPGLYPVLMNGVNVSYAYTNAQFDSVHQRQPRTALGISEDNRYLILITIDGRQELSDGAFDYETADFLLLFGAWNGLNLDGGGSTCMVKADECGTPVDINQNSYQFAVGRPGSQRPVGCNLGIYAAALPRGIQNLTIQPGTSTAILRWQTAFPSTTQVQYGLTTNYSSVTPLDSRMLRSHVATLAGLIPGSNYYFRAMSFDGDTEHTFSCTLSTTSAVNRTLVIEMTDEWRFSTNNLDGVNWMAAGYNDSTWDGPFSACFHIESTSSAPFAPRNTLLPPGFVVPIFRTYYFRTPFVFTGSTAGITLTFSNYIDDGAIFYLNGSELARVRLPAFPTPVFNSTAANSGVCTGTPYQGDAAAVCPDVFSVPGSGLVQGTNVVAVEVHNVSGGSTSQDIFFGSAMFVNQPATTGARLFIITENGQSTIYWNGQGLTLQKSTDLSSPANWSDVSGPVTQSPYAPNEAGTTFYRLRN